MTKRMLADVLWEAANVHLSPHDSYGWNGYTCCAVACAINLRDEYEYAEETEALKFLATLGCNTGSHGNVLTALFDEGEERQGVRYMWLLLAMHVAEDEGIEL
jgi:hypothetical protein